MERKELLRVFGPAAVTLLDEYAGLADQHSAQARSIEQQLLEQFGISLGPDLSREEEPGKDSRGAYDFSGGWLGSV